MARVTIYMTEELHRRWRESWVNLSKLVNRSLSEVLDRGEDGAGTLYLCEVCERRIGRALRIPAEPAEVRLMASSVAPAPAPSRNGNSAA